MSGNSRAASTLVAFVVAAAVVVQAVVDINGLLATVCYLGVLVGASAGAWIGAERAPHEHRFVPRLIAAGITFSALGDVLWSVLDLTGGGTDVSIADPPWFASYVLICVALWVVLVRTHGGVDLGFAVDAVTIVAVSVLVFWSLSVGAIVADHSVSPFVRAVWASYPIADAVLLALVMRLLMSRSARAAIDARFALGICLWLAADVAYLQAPGAHLVQAAMNAAWMIAPVLLARAAWRVRDLTPEASNSSPVAGAVPQLMIAIVPLSVPTTLELIDHLHGGESDHPLQLFVGTAALIALAFVRTARLIRSEDRARRELEDARDAALEASRAKSMFLANMSHEIRTPLTTVLASAELLEDTPLDDLQLELLGKMYRSGDLLKTLVEGILDFSRIEAGQLELVEKPFDLHAMVADAADVYELRGVQVGVRFDCDLDPSVPGMVVGDPGRLYQVLTNLLDNAFKFTSHGTVGLTVRPATGDDSVEHADRPDGNVEFLVTDTGIGIPPEDLVAVFESFRQVDGSTTRRYGGSGLGLAICMELTQLMGGTISVESRVGAGSAFLVRIPLPSAVIEGSADDLPVRPVLGGPTLVAS